MDRGLVVALVVGILQGLFEWLPISSEGNVALYLTAVEGLPPETATRFSLFLHAGTALAAAAYYRRDLRVLLAGVPGWLRSLPPGAGDRGMTDGGVPVHDGPDPAAARPELSFLVVATLASGAVGIAAYAALEAVVSQLAGGAFVVAVGVLLIAVGVLQRVAASVGLGDRQDPTAADAVLVGALQGLAILPGVSRSGTTVSALLLRGYAAPAAFRLSFLLSIPAALGAAALVFLDVGVPAIAPAAALGALAASAVVGYLTVDALVRAARRLPFWAVCVALGALAVLGGALLVA
jgi:undecaprenyl-diphosphatase